MRAKQSYRILASLGLSGLFVLCLIESVTAQQRGTPVPTIDASFPTGFRGVDPIHATASPSPIYDYHKTAPLTIIAPLHAETTEQMAPTFIWAVEPTAKWYELIIWRGEQKYFKHRF
jgi:hypothetical protein